MDQGSDQLTQRIAATREDMESRIVELRRRGQEAARATGKVLVVALAAGAVVGAVVGGVVVYRRYRRPATAPGRMARVLHLDDFREKAADMADEVRGRFRPAVELSSSRAIDTSAPRWHKIGLRFAEAAGSAAGAAVVSQLMARRRQAS